MTNFVSIIIPALNAEHYAYQSFKALNSLDYPADKYEVILVDNGSEDRTVDIAEEFNIKVYIKPDLTIAGLRNYGARKAKGDVLAFVDADCIVSAEWLKKMPYYFSDRKVGVVGSYPVIPENATWVEKTWFLNKLHNKEVHEARWLSSMNLIIRKDLFDDIGGFNESLVTCEDVDLCYRIPPDYKIISDRGITVTHLGEAKSLCEFFKKERWRGKGNLRGVLTHGLSWREFPSIAIPAYYLILIFMILPVILNGFYTQSYYLVWVYAVLFLFPPIVSAARVAFLSKQTGYIFRLSIVYLTYFIARAFALTKK